MRVRYIALFAGAALFGWILYRADLHAVGIQLRVVQAHFIWPVLIYGIALCCNTFGWRFALPPEQRTKVTWARLFGIRLAGQALNILTPAASLGGEPLKVYRINQSGVPLADAAASVVVAKTSFVLAMLAFCIAGLGVTLVTQSPTVALVSWVWIVLPVLSILLALLLAVQFFQPFGRTLRIFRRFMPWVHHRFSPTAEDWDETVAAFYRRRPQSVAGSFVAHLAGWMLGVVEVYVIFRLLDAPQTWPMAMSLEALWVLLKSAGVVIPGALGASEGALLLVCAGLGVPATTGLALALVRRARELLWLSLGLLEAMTPRLSSRALS